MTKVIKIEPGSILLWKEYKWFRRLVNCILWRKPDYNRAMLVEKEMDLTTIPELKHAHNFRIISPIIPYTKEEIKTLKKHLKLVNIFSNGSIDSLMIAINSVRKGTINPQKFKLDSLLINKNYDEICIG